MCFFSFSSILMGLFSACWCKVLMTDSLCSSVWITNQILVFGEVFQYTTSYIYIQHSPKLAAWYFLHLSGELDVAVHLHLWLQLWIVILQPLMVFSELFLSMGIAFRNKIVFLPSAAGGQWNQVWFSTSSLVDVTSVLYILLHHLSWEITSVTCWTVCPFSFFFSSHCTELFLPNHVMLNY